MPRSTPSSARSYVSTGSEKKKTKKPRRQRHIRNCLSHTHHTAGACLTHRGTRAGRDVPTGPDARSPREWPAHDRTDRAEWFLCARLNCRESTWQIGFAVWQRAQRLDCHADEWHSFVPCQICPGRALASLRDWQHFKTTVCHEWLQCTQIPSCGRTHNAPHYGALVRRKESD